MLEVGPSLPHRLSTHKELQLAAEACAWQSQGGFFFWLCHSPILPSSVTGFRQKTSFLQCVSFSSEMRWRESLSAQGPVTGAEGCMATRQAPPVTCHHLWVGRQRSDSQGLGPAQIFPHFHGIIQKKVENGVLWKTTCTCSYWPHRNWVEFHTGYGLRELWRSC